MAIEIGDILKCIKTVKYSDVFSGENRDVEVDYGFQEKGKKYAVLFISKCRDSNNNTRTTILVDDEVNDGVGFTLERNVSCPRPIEDYFISVKEHRKNIIDGYKKR